MIKAAIKFTLSMLAMLFLCCVLPSNTIQATAPAVPFVDGNVLYANGRSLLIETDGSGGTTVKYYDEVPTGEWVPVTSLDSDLSTYTIYGGSKEEEVTSDITITMTGGTVAAIYGGGYNNANATETANVTGNINVIVSGGTVTGVVYGGGYSVGASTSTSSPADVTGNTSVTIKGDAQVGSVYGGGVGVGAGNSATVSGNTSVTITENAQVSSSVYGGGKEVTGSTSVEISGNAIVSGDVYGAGTNVGQNTSVILSDNVKVGGSVYGAGSVLSTVTGNTLVEINGGEVAGSVYGGGAWMTAVKGNTVVTLNSGTVQGDVYGAGTGDDDSGYYVYGTTTVTVNSTVGGSIYGGYKITSGEADHFVEGTRTFTTNTIVQTNTVVADSFDDIFNPKASATDSTGAAQALAAATEGSVLTITGADGYDVYWRVGESAGFTQAPSNTYTITSADIGQKIYVMIAESDGAVVEQAYITTPVAAAVPDTSESTSTSDSTSDSVSESASTSESTSASTSETTTTVPQTGDSDWMMLFATMAICAAALMMVTRKHKNA